MKYGWDIATVFATKEIPNAVILYNTMVNTVANGELINLRCRNSHSGVTMK